jgi:hypothetical protein
MPAVLRSRTASKETPPPDLVDSTESDSTLDLTPPTYQIDLSLPPSKRYVDVAKAFAPHLQDVTGLFDLIVQSWGLPISLVRFLCRIFLFRLHSTQETQELKGISKAINVDMFLLVAFNTFLDLFMGCTSGAARVSRGKNDGGRMLHFRTLDWGMDALRKLIVKYEYVQDGKVVGTSMGYFGFVGLLTAVRKDLSLSLNFRPNRNNTTFFGNLSYAIHLLLVLLGFRRSIASNLRQRFFNHKSRSISELAKSLSTLPSTAAYITLCDGDKTIIMEKDLHTANIREDVYFMTVTNHDVSCEPVAESGEDTIVQCGSGPNAALFGPIKDLLTDSMDRKKKMHKFWKDCSKKHGAKADMRVVRTVQNIAEWLENPPILNEETHFAVVMDPKAGKIIYLKRYLKPV